LFAFFCAGADIVAESVTTFVADLAARFEAELAARAKVPLSGDKGSP